MSDNIKELEYIENLTKIMNDNELSELYVESEGTNLKVRLKKGSSATAMPYIPYPGQAEALTQSAKQAIAAASAEIRGNIVVSPIVGTFYAAPAPDKSAFASVGDRVERGQVVCIIESMKLMNEITSDFSGIVTEIYVNDGDPVEFDQKIMRIE